MRHTKASKDDFEEILTQEVQQAIRDADNLRALGADDLAPLMLKKLGPKAAEYITRMFNINLQSGIITSI